jgi:hypothetical protein
VVEEIGMSKFDGAWLVQNFENQNPANTLWTKQYNFEAECRWIACPGSQRS